MVLERRLDHPDERLARRGRQVILQDLQFQPGFWPDSGHGVGVPGTHPEARRKHRRGGGGRAGLAHRDRVLARSDGHVVGDVAVGNVLQHSRVAVVAERIHVNVNGRSVRRQVRAANPADLGRCRSAGGRGRGRGDRGQESQGSPEQRQQCGKPEKSQKRSHSYSPLIGNKMPAPRRDAPAVTSFTARALSIRRNFRRSAVPADLAHRIRCAGRSALPDGRWSHFRAGTAFVGSVPGQGRR